MVNLSLSGPLGLLSETCAEAFDHRFYTNLPGYDKNWLWRGDDLWNDRWEQVLYLQPEWVEIISWNDYGESHYIGPIVDKALGALEVGEAPYDYVSDFPHDGWRQLLPFYIDMYTVRRLFFTHVSYITTHVANGSLPCNPEQRYNN